MRKIFVISLFVLLNIAVVLSCFNMLEKDPLLVGMKRFASVFETLSEHYVDSLSSEQLFNAAVAGLQDNVDPFTGYMPPRQFQYYEEESQGEFYGIGVEITVRDGLITVISPIAGTPAEAAGLRAGDQVTMIDDFEASTLDPDDAIDLIRGAPGTTVNLKIRRPGLSQDFLVKIKRAGITLNSVDYAGENGKLGYIRLTKFALNSFHEMLTAIANLNKNEIEGLVLDLRGNPGGFLEIAVAITGLFLPQDALIVFTGGRNYTENFSIHNFIADGYHDIPMVVLVGSGSASASEILSGALQDYDRAVILGDTTFGKGLVQNISDLPDGGAFRLTVSKYYLPSGRIIQKFTDKIWSRNVNYDEDLLTEKFYTQNGREVGGGGGVVPDIIVDEEKPTVLEAYLVYGGFYFDFALEYFKENGQSVNLPVDDSVLKDFNKFVSISDIELSSEIEYAYAEFSKILKSKGLYEKNSALLNSIESKIERTHEDIWTSCRERIRHNLSRVMAGMMYSKKQRYENYDLKFDPLIQQAFDILADQNKYKNILQSSEVKN